MAQLYHIFAPTLKYTMMTIDRVNNLYEVWQYCQQLMKLTMNQIEDIPVERLVSLYEQANCHAREETYRLANELGIVGIKDVQLHGIYKKSALGKCFKDGRIVLSFSFLFYLDYPGVIGVLIHELCHIVHQNHKKEFWQLYESCIRKVGLIDNNYNGWKEKQDNPNDPFMYLTPWKCAIHSKKYSTIRKKMFCGKTYVMSDRFPICRTMSKFNQKIHFGLFPDDRKQEYIHNFISYMLRQQCAISLDFSDLQFLKDEKIIFYKEYNSYFSQDERPMRTILRLMEEDTEVNYEDYSSCIVCMETQQANLLLMAELSSFLNTITSNNSNMNVLWTYRNGTNNVGCKTTIVLSY